MKVEPIKPPFPEFMSVKLHCSKGHYFTEDFGVNDEREVECLRCGEKALVTVVEKKVTIQTISKPKNILSRFFDIFRKNRCNE